MAAAVQRDDRYNVCAAMNAYTDAVGRLDPILNEPYQMLKDMPDVLSWKGMGAAAGGFVGIISKIQKQQKKRYLGMYWSGR